MIKGPKPPVFDKKYELRNLTTIKWLINIYSYIYDNEISSFKYRLGNADRMEANDNPTLIYVRSCGDNIIYGEAFNDYLEDVEEFPQETLDAFPTIHQEPPTLTDIRLWVVFMKKCGFEYEEPMSIWKDNTRNDRFKAELAKTYETVDGGFDEKDYIYDIVLDDQREIESEEAEKEMMNHFKKIENGK